MIYFLRQCMIRLMPTHTRPVELLNSGMMLAGAHVLVFYPQSFNAVCYIPGSQHSNFFQSYNDQASVQLWAAALLFVGIGQLLSIAIGASAQFIRTAFCFISCLAWTWGAATIYHNIDYYAFDGPLMLIMAFSTGWAFVIQVLSEYKK